MADYTNLVCPVCKERFSAEDDIVVCPICGTPHHRECWAKEGRCANSDWHSENKTYNAEEERSKINEEQAKAEAENEAEGGENKTIICPRCSAQNDSQALFCNRCGAPISSGFGAGGENGKFSQGHFYGAMPFGTFVAQNENELIDGVEAWKLTSVVKENKIRFLFFFKTLNCRKSKTSFNFAAFMFGPLYFLYRKMYGLGIVTMLLTLIINAPSLVLSLTNEYLSEIAGTTVTYGLSLSQEHITFLMSVTYLCSLLATALRFACGLYANWFYLRKCKKIATKIDSEVQTREEFVSKANKKGGVNRALIIALGVVYMISIWTAVFMSTTPGILG